MSADHIAIVMAGALSGGFVAGLAGFGTGLVAVGIWLHALPPAVAASLVVICSVVSQLQTIPTVWRYIRPRHVLPFIIPGLIGVPVGTRLLTDLNPDTFRFCIGILLLGFSVFSLLCGRGLKVKWDGRIADGTVGLAAGVLGGLAGLSGPLPTMWAAIRGWDKDQRRSLFQAFNLSILLAALLSHAMTGHLTAEVGWAVIAALPGTLIGAWLGSRVYLRLTDQHFHTIILCLLAFSGMTLLWGSWRAFCLGT